VSETVCITCCATVGEPYRLNRLDDGQICPTCRERVLASLPPIFPSAPVPQEVADTEAAVRDPEPPPSAS
jgi:hypothetical protein